MDQTSTMRLKSFTTYYLMFWSKIFYTQGCPRFHPVAKFGNKASKLGNKASKFGESSFVVIERC